jgi:hypothetical protein
VDGAAGPGRLPPAREPEIPKIGSTAAALLRKKQENPTMKHLIKPALVLLASYAVSALAIWLG